jgi:hypothetical protein
MEVGGTPYTSMGRLGVNGVSPSDQVQCVFHSLSQTHRLFSAIVSCSDVKGGSQSVRLEDGEIVGS